MSQDLEALIAAAKEWRAARVDAVAAFEVRKQKTAPDEMKRLGAAESALSDAVAALKARRDAAPADNRKAPGA